MATNIQVRRLARVSQVMRTDRIPEAPQIPQSMVDKFPDLKKFNEDMKLWVERLKNCMEPDITELDQNAG